MANQTLSTLMIDNMVRAEASKLGVIPEAVDDVILRAKALYTIKDGVATPMADGKVVYGKDGTSPMPIAEWLTSVKKSARHLFLGSQGSGAGGGGNNSGGVDLSKMTPAQKIAYGMRQGGLMSDLPKS